MNEHLHFSDEKPETEKNLKSHTLAGKIKQKILQVG